MRIDEMEKLPVDHPDYIPPPSKEKTPDNDEPETFKVGQKVIINGGKHKKLIKDNEICIIQEVRKTFLVVQVSGPETVNGRSIQCHRKFITSFKEELPEPVLEQPPAPEGETMPHVADDCVIVEKLPEETPDKQGETNITSEIKDVVEEVKKPTTARSPSASVSSSLSKDDEIVRLKGVISDLEADIVSYRDMMLGHQNELEYLRKETGPTQEEKKLKNEKLIECIKILLSLQ
jgi:uncharacterized protein YbcI